MNYYIEIISPNKAKNDVDVIVGEMGFVSLTPRQARGDAFSRFWTKLASIFRILTVLKRGDILFLQYPMKKFFRISCIFAHLKHAKVVSLIHDLGAFRRHKLTPAGENRLLSHSDVIIVHNESMERWLLDHGYVNKIIRLGIFDYISPAEACEQRVPHHPWSVIFAGGLGVWRSGFLYALDKIPGTCWQMNLYGRGLDEKILKSWHFIDYKGCLPTDELVASVKGDFGLVWDGDSIDRCSGNWGEYLLINNPHKTSLYLRCNLPVLIWSKAAIAPFLLSHKCCLTFDSLEEVDGLLSSLAPEKYAELQRNAVALGKKIGSGYFIRTALAAAFEYLH